MSSRGKKTKKKATHAAKTKDTPTNKKIYSYFTPDEITEIKSTLKVKDVTGVPLVIAATFLNKPDTLKKLVKDGYNVNQSGQNNMTALMWAVKYKYLDIVDFLLANGADPTVKTDSGDNVLILSLEHKLWDEQSTIALWKSIKKVSFIDVNFTNKNGHSMLHMCVRRDWEELLKLLLAEKPNVDAGNSNGVTPLMLACFRNNINIVDVLIEAGADISKEDNHGRMTLCYAISSSSKMAKMATDRIVEELQRRKLVEVYLKRRLELVVATARKTDFSCATADMLIKIIQFAVQVIPGGVKIFLKCNVFVLLLEVLSDRLEQAAAVRFLLEICKEVLKYDEESVGFDAQVVDEISKSFFNSRLVEVVLKVVESNTDESKIAFDVFLLAFKDNEGWTKILTHNCATLLKYLDASEAQEQTTTLNSKRQQMKKVFETLKIVSQPHVDSSDKLGDKRKSDKILTKKPRRRCKTIKSKLTKLKSADLTKRLNSSSKRPYQKLTKTKPNNDFLLDAGEPSDLNPISSSLQHLLEEPPETPTTENKAVLPQWKNQIITMAHTDMSKSFPLDLEKLSCAITHLRESSRSPQKYSFETSRAVVTIVEYLKRLVKLIVQKYREHWQNDKRTGSCNCVESNEHVPWLFNRHLRSLESKEQHVVQELQKNFDNLIKGIKDLALRDLEQFVKSVNQLEETLLTFEIRGIRVFSYICGMDNFTLKYKMQSPGLEEDEVIKYAQNVVNELEEVRPEIAIEVVDHVDDVSFTETYKSETPIELYYKEMSLLGKPPPKNKTKEIEAKLNTIANGFHLINSMMSLCDVVEGQVHKYTISDLNFTLKPKKPPLPPKEKFDRRLRTQIASLLNPSNHQVVLGGRMRIPKYDLRLNFLVAAGTNFCASELGVDPRGEPLNIKRIPRDEWLAKVLKPLVDPLIGFVGQNILPYVVCDYEDKELLLATPLCRYSLGQYVHLLQQDNPAEPMDIPTSGQVVKQMFEGLLYLHKCEVPIVHGNLKPSNIFIGFDGRVKLAEFGIHKALYKMIEAPKSSLIWFASETLEIYRNSNLMECSLQSDIQVAGMILYFVITHGKHPFGDDANEILKNVHRGSPKLNLRNSDLVDLLAWMLNKTIEERPHIEQVLSHPFFWIPSLKGTFILKCAGVNNNGHYVPFNVDKLHRSVDLFFEGEIDWHDAMRAKFPAVRITEANNICGLLKFVRHCYDHRIELEMSEMDIVGGVLDVFPLLPAGLYRSLQKTNWLKNPVFESFIVTSCEGL